ncbi:MAG: peptidylprolyl isomerase [Gammaproteobacteria bacterium]|nr:peptidylprolyl isomerase [Gammaproteobacteria bacterium]
MTLLKMIAPALILSLLSACSGSNNSGPDKRSAALTQFTNTADLTTVVISTSAGDIEIALDSARAPETVKNFLSYVDNGFYSGTIFHRVIKDFMIQGGGFTTDYEKKVNQPAVKNEADNGLRNEKYTIAMARTAAPHSATSQFFINTKNNGFLNHSSKSTQGWGYAVFGIVTSGKDIVDQINTVSTGPDGPFQSDAPQKQVVIKSVTRKL